MRTEVEYILLILNCKKYINKASFQKSTWLKDIPSSIKYYHVIGNPELDKPIYDDNNNILYVNSKDDYCSLPDKVIKAIKAIDEKFSYKYIFKTDDDQNLTYPLFFYELLHLVENSKPHYGGKIVHLLNDSYSSYFTVHPELPRNILLKKTYYCNGRFYILSKHAVMNLIEKKDAIKAEYFEDYAIGYHLDNTIKTNFLDIANDVFKDNC